MSSIESDDLKLAPLRHEAEEHIFRLRTGREVTARSERKAKDETSQTREEFKRILRELIDVDDQVGDAMHLLDSVEKIGKDDFSNLLRGLRNSLESILKRRDVHRVGVLKKNYEEVEFEGQLIQHPWEEDGEESDGGLHEQRSLWVKSDKGKISRFRPARLIWKKTSS